MGMTRRELLATAVAAPLAPVASIRPDSPWMRVTVTCCDTGYTETTHYSEIEQYHIAELADGDTFVVETSEHGPIEYRHRGTPGEAIYMPVHQGIFGPSVQSLL